MRRIAVTSERREIISFTAKEIYREELDRMKNHFAVQEERQAVSPSCFGDMVHETGKQLSCIQSVAADQDGM